MNLNKLKIKTKDEFTQVIIYKINDYKGYYLISNSIIIQINSNKQSNYNISNHARQKGITILHIKLYLCHFAL